MRMLTLAGLIAGLAGLSATGAASAQWGIAAEIGVTRFGGSSRDTSGTAVGPYRPTTFELRLDHGLGPVRGTVCVLYAKTPFAGEQPGLAVVQSDFASVWESRRSCRSAWRASASEWTCGSRRGPPSRRGASPAT